MKLGDVLQGVAAWRRLKRLEDWYDAGYRAYQEGKDATRTTSDPDEQTAYAAGWTEAKQGKARQERTT